MQIALKHKNGRIFFCIQSFLTTAALTIGSRLKIKYNKNQIHKSVDNFRFNLHVEENLNIFVVRTRKKNIKRLQAHDIYYSIYECIFFCMQAICSMIKTFSDLSNDYLNKFVVAHVHVDFCTLNL